MATTAPYEKPLNDDEDRQASINRENLEIQKHLHDLYAKEANFDKWLDNTDKYLRDLAQQDVRECNLDLYAYARAVVEYHRYMRRQKNKRHSLEIPQSELESPFLSTRLRADHTKDLGAILRASDRPELPADQQQFLEFFSEQSKRGQRLRRLEEAAYSRLYNLKTSERVDEGIAKTLGERFGLRAAADGYQRAALQAVLRKHIYHKEQYYVGSWENNIVRLPWKTRPRLVAKLEGQKRDYYPWTNKFLRFENRRFEDADKTRALRELVRPLCNNEAVPDDIAITLIRTKILNENIVPDSDSSTAKPEPASQVWGFPLPDELKPVQPEDYFGPEKITVTNGGKRKATTGHGPRSKRPRHDSYSSSEDESKYGEIPLGFGKIMPPEIKNYWLSPGDQAKAKNLDEKEKICSFDGLPFFYLAETNHLAVLKSKHLKDVEGHLEKWEIAQQKALPGAPAFRGDRRRLPYWMRDPGQDNYPQLRLPMEDKSVTDWELELTQLTRSPSAHTNDEEQPLARALRRPNLPEAQVDPQMQGQEEAVEPGNVAAPPPTFPPPFYHFRESQLHSRKN